LNYHKLAELVVGTEDIVSSVYFFTTFARWKWKQDSGTKRRHRQYVKALRSAKVEVIQGRFLRADERCPLCRDFYPNHVEKRTDVNIALRLLGDAIEDIFDKAVIVSADSDLLPAIAAVHHHTPGKEVGVMFPIGRTSFDLRQHADFRLKMPEKLLGQSQFPDAIQVDSITLRRPDSWT